MIASIPWFINSTSRGTTLAQDFKNHTRWHPAFHFFLVPLLLINIGFAITYCVRHYSQHRHLAPWMIVMALVLFMIAEMARGNAMKVQDRVIRLEEKLRIASLVSASELVELESLTMRQYVALRFASNVELPDLARRAVREKMDSKQIKGAIKAWRADEDRV
jgi:hypothetical protein